MTSQMQTVEDESNAYLTHRELNYHLLYKTKFDFISGGLNVST